MFNGCRQCFFSVLTVSPTRKGAIEGALDLLVTTHVCTPGGLARLDIALSTHD
jgi:hypothetical protein